MATTHPRFGRRSILAGAASLAAMAGVGGVTACSTTSGGGVGNDAQANSATVLPTYIPYTGATPDLASTPEGVEVGFHDFPTRRPASVAQKPGSGSESLLGMANIYVAIPPGVDGNSWWSGLNDRLGVDLKMTIVPATDYGSKFATTIAGDDLPDLMQMQVVADFPQLLDAKFTALDEYLSGDAIKDYPNLANLPTFTWRNSVYNGHIYGIPIPRGRIGNYDLIRSDIFDERGVDPDISGGWDGFMDMCETVTDATSRRWAYSFIGSAVASVQRINEVPNQWSEEGGTLTHMFATDQYRQAIQDVITMWKAGVIHPDAFNPQQPYKTLFNGGNTVVQPDGYLAWAGYVVANKSNASFEQGLMTLTNRDGSKPAPWIPGPGYYSINALNKKSDPETIKLALRVCDYLAAPFGTDEQFFLTYGIEGTHHELDSSGNPVLTDRGISDIAVPVNYLGASPHALYQPGRPQDVDVQHAYQSAMLPLSLENPTQGLFSNTAVTDGVVANRNQTNDIYEIIQGRKPFSDLDTVIDTWMKTAGTAMKQEYEDQLQSEGGPT